jgi:hypothetical protein
MSTSFHCDDKETLIAFIYDELDAETRRQVSAHLVTCAACASEVEGLLLVRQDLAQWQPPEIALNFEIAQRPATVLRPSRWSLPAVPAWAQLAAAVLVFAVGAAIANVQVRYDASGLTVSTGWMTPNLSSVANDGNRVAPPEEWRPALAALETDLRKELQLVRSTARPTAFDGRAVSAQPLAAAAPAAATVDGNALMRRVQSLIDDSERRQRQELALRLTQVNRDFEIQRRADLMKINADFRQLQGRTGYVEGYQREIANVLRRVSSTQQVP